MCDPQSESAGVVKISDEGAVVIPVEVREVLAIKVKEAFLRIEDISVELAVSVSVGVSVSAPDVSVSVAVVVSARVSVAVPDSDGTVVVSAGVKLMSSGVGPSSVLPDCSAQPATAGRSAILVTFSSFRRYSSIG